MHDILSRVKAQPHIYPSMDLVYSPKQPLIAPVILKLPANGFRLRFDGPDQRLRLIEVLDFSKTLLTYNSKDVVKLPETSGDSADVPSTPGPTFRHVYDKMIGPSFPGEYVPPTTHSGSFMGSYVLSYPGIAFTFPLQDSAWSKSNDFVSVLSSSAAAPAKSMAIFNGSSWQDARQDLYIKECTLPRSLALSSRGKEMRPDEIDLVRVLGNGRVELVRRSSSIFHIQLSQTTPQDLLTELGPPDAIYRKSDRRLAIHKDQSRTGKSHHHRYGATPPRYDDTTDTDQSSTNTTTDDSDVQDEEQTVDATQEDASPECFYNYFSHGFDVFLSYSTPPSRNISGDEELEGRSEMTCSDQVVATKILLHGNVPGSYPFNRYRRSRWALSLIPGSSKDSHMDSESPFSALFKSLQRVWEDNSSDSIHKDSFQRGMVLNRGWGNSPGSSCELLGGWEENTKSNTKGREGADAPGLGNTELFGFPGLVFEVLKNDTVSCLTVY